MDRITKTLLKEFVEENGLDLLEENDAFEHFIAHVITSSVYSESFSTEDIVVGGGGDSSIDSIAIVVNGQMVTGVDEVKDLSETNGYLDVTFVLVQAERSSSFDTKKIGQFEFGVQDFLSESPQLSQNEKIKQYRNVVDYIYSQVSKFKNGNPQCYLYYVTTGKWTEDKNLVVRITSAKQALEDLGIFRKVVFECIDAGQIQILYRESQNAIAREIVFEVRAVVPDIEGVEQAYIGLLRATEYLKLVENNNGEMITSLFYDNVRHWQEWNQVNSEMNETLKDDEQSIYFPLLNNGITIIARSIQPTGNKFYLEDYQIVNGCQTSFVLHSNRDRLSESIMVPVRLIATQNEKIKNAIIKATNRQTEVTEEQFFALTEFPKKLEVYFPSFEAKRKLYYERRSRQYNSETSIEKVRIVNMTALVRAFASFFLDIPHRTTRNYKALLKSIGKQIFNKDHQLDPYYLCAYANYRLDFLFRNQTILSDLKPAKYHILTAFRVLAQPDDIPRLNSNEIKKYCSEFLELLWDDETSKAKFVESANLVRNVAAGDLNRDNIRTEAFTERLLLKLKEIIEKQELSEGNS